MRIDISQRIGVCYKDESWAREVFDQLLRQIPPQMVYKHSDRRIELIDGSYIMRFPATDSARGRKLNKIYIQEGIDEEYINTVLKPCIIHKSILRETIIDPTGEVYFW
jgi:hypothetical protein